MAFGESHDDDISLGVIDVNEIFPFVGVTAYLTSDVTYNSGIGDYEDPYIINE